jgi:SAM-dependent methyltransferase
MDIHENKKQHWDASYETKSYVTNSSTKSIFNYHELEIPKNKLILDIGVGQGDFIKILSQNNTLIGADVSENALKTVKPYCKKTYFSKNLNKIEKVDLAICHLVLQHNHEYEVARNINDVNLKNDGIFSFQFAALNLDKPTLSRKAINNINKSMYYFYSPEKMESIVNSTNKKIIKMIGPIWFGDPFDFDWYIFQVNNVDFVENKL